MMIFKYEIFKFNIFLGIVILLKSLSIHVFIKFGFFLISQ